MVFKSRTLLYTLLPKVKLECLKLEVKQPVLETKLILSLNALLEVFSHLKFCDGIFSSGVLFFILGTYAGYLSSSSPHIKKHQQLSKTDLKNVWKVFPEGKGTDTAAVVAAIWQQTAM